MRKNLKNQEGVRTKFRGTVDRFGTKANWHGLPEPTLLLKNILFAETSREATDHLWFTVGKTIERLQLQPGDTVEFEARVVLYEKGYVNERHGIDDRQVDYKLNRPTKFKIILA